MYSNFVSSLSLTCKPQRVSVDIMVAKRYLSAFLKNDATSRIALVYNRDRPFNRIPADLGTQLVRETAMGLSEPMQDADPFLFYFFVLFLFCFVFFLFFCW